MKRIKLLLVLLLTGICGLFAQNTKDIKVVAYFSGAISQLDSFDVNRITHLIYCFGHLDGSRFKLDKAKDTTMIQKMVSLKSKNPRLKVLLSMGGWGGCESCSDGFATSAKRQEFAASVKELTDYFKTDGVDIDWEYPTVRLDNDIDKNPVHKNTPEDKDHFTDLVKLLRNTLGKNATITFAAGGFNTYLKHALDWKKVMRYADFINLMSYDLINGYSVETGHHSPLYSTSKDPESVDNAVRYLVKNGVDPGKIVIGAAFYARIWENVPAQNNGLYQSGKFKQSVAYNEFANVLGAQNGYQDYWDDTARAPYSYSAAQKTFATYDDKRSVELKTQYAIDNKLGGIMFWELGSDVYSNGLLDAITDTNRSFQITENPGKKQIDISYNNKLLTSYCYYDSGRKPVLFPVNTLDGITVTRGYPFDPRPGERTDHPHHTGIWLNYESVNGLDFWNNSTAIAFNKRDEYGTIVHQKVIDKKAGSNHAMLTIAASWIRPDHKTLINEQTTFDFTVEDGSYFIDRKTTLTADTTVLFKDAKDGMMAIRVARELEMPSKEATSFIDNKGNVTKMDSMGNSDVTGMYHSSEGINGDSVWSTRAKWVTLTGKKDGRDITIAMIDHPSNPGYPSYWHARGYGLFAVNPLGQKIFSKGAQEMNLTLQKGQSVTFRYRIIIHSGKVFNDEQMNNYADDFAKYISK